MQQIIKFFIQFKIGILFFILFAFALWLTIQSHSYHNNKWISSTNAVSSFFLSKKHKITSYFSLTKENESLHSENVFLKNKLYSKTLNQKDSLSQDLLYNLKPCLVISNSFNKIDNFILIDKGTKDFVKEGYAVTIPNGILGIVEKSTKNYSRVISILNTNLSINAKLKHNNQFGSMKWDGKSLNTMKLIDLPRSANFKIGDTIVTGSNSLIFPKNIPIGVIKNYNLESNSGYYNINIQLFADMTNLNQAYVIIPNKIIEAQELLKQNEPD